ncbi:MAG TPA: hypothetical protein VF748_14560, partial [Candidatus Acidoferrum sp.]
MAKKIKPRTDAEETTGTDLTSYRQTDDRSQQLIGDDIKNPNEVEEACLELIKDVERGYTHQWDRSNQQLDFWDVYHCNLGPKQFYSGNSKI